MRSHAFPWFRAHRVMADVLAEARRQTPAEVVSLLDDASLYRPGKLVVQWSPEEDALTPAQIRAIRGTP